MQAFSLTFRQKQLAKLTPSELIETAYLSALLEQQPHLGHSRGFSHLFETLRNFLTKVVDIVPIESLVHAICIADDKATALLCCRQFMATKTNFHFTSLYAGLWYALERMILDSTKVLGESRMKPLPRSFRERLLKQSHDFQSLGLPKVTKKEVEKILEGNLKEYVSDTTDSMVRLMLRSSNFANTTRIANEFMLDNELRSSVLADNPLASELIFLANQVSSAMDNSVGLSAKTGNAISGSSLKNVYPVHISEQPGECCLKSPLQILVEGRKRLQWLARQASETGAPAAQNSLKLSQLYNTKMLEIVSKVCHNELKVCSLLLGAFMEEQIRVPLMKTSFETAKAIEHAASNAALGVWALFSLSYGDVKGLLSAIPSQSLLVEVKEYIKGVFKQDTETADRNYAGKLQFMIQGMDETVSCNSHYVSYSLERQLVKLCAELKIDESTPLETLIGEWDEIFKDNVMSLVVQSHRSLIARWLKWALMVHHLREELACYTSVGVIGLVNSGKSLLVSTLFNVKVRPIPL